MNSTPKAAGSRSARRIDTYPLLGVHQFLADDLDVLDRRFHLGRAISRAASDDEVEDLINQYLTRWMETETWQALRWIGRHQTLPVWIEAELHKRRWDAA